MKNYNLNLIRKKHCYSIKEISKLLGVCKKTVTSWHKKGLITIDENKSNMLFYGEEVYNFLFELTKKRKVKLTDDEFYCVACHKAVNGVPKSRHITLTGKQLGENAKQVIIRAKCEICDNKIRKFSSERIKSKNEQKEEIKETYKEIKGEQLVLPIFPQEG
jgi:DNA-binding transcriptional MerR regulator